MLWASEQDSPAAHGEDNGEAAVPLEVHSGTGGCPKEIVTHWKAMLEPPPWQERGGCCGSVEREPHTGAGLLSGLVTVKESYARAACS